MDSKLIARREETSKAHRGIIHRPHIDGRLIIQRTNPIPTVVPPRLPHGYIFAVQIIRKAMTAPIKPVLFEACDAGHCLQDRVLS